MADYRDGKEEICVAWTRVDLRALGEVNRVAVEFDVHNASGLVGPRTSHGMSICIDEIAFEVPAGCSPTRVSPRNGGAAPRSGGRRFFVFLRPGRYSHFL